MISSLDPPSKMGALQALRKDKNGLYLISFVFFVYFVVMDVILYVTFQNTTVLSEKKQGRYSPFQPLTIKLMMTDPIDHYIICPSTEYFNDMTQFSHVFYFITPNMISFFHVFVAIVASKFAASELLYNRRIAVVIFEFRCWLDGFDGVVYRSRVGATHIFKSHRSTMGYLIDTGSDTLGGAALCIAIAVCLCRNPPLKIQQDILPWTKTNENGSGNGRQNGHVSKWTAFWRVFCFGMLLALSSGAWDRTVDRLSSILQVPISDQQDKARQVEAMHSTSTCILLWLWRICDGQAMLQMVLIALFIDKLWEFFTFMLYIGWPVIIGLIVLSEIQIRSLHEKLRM